MAWMWWKEDGTKGGLETTDGFELLIPTKPYGNEFFHVGTAPAKSIMIDWLCDKLPLLKWIEKSKGDLN